MKIGLIADIHENIQSLIEVCDRIQKFNVDAVYCLGDISGYTAPYYFHFENRNATECLQLIRDNCTKTILGNHDLNAIQRLPTLDQIFEYPPNWFELSYQEKKELSGEKLWLYEYNELDPLYYQEDIEYLKQQEEIEIVRCDDYQILLSHYLYPNISGSGQIFYFKYQELKEHFLFMKAKNCKITFFGHSHYPGITVFYEDGQMERPFRKINLKNKSCCISVPAVARSNNNNGFLIYDSEEMSVRGVKF